MRATQFISHYNDRSKNFVDTDCEEHFYPKQTRSKTEVDYSSLQIIELGGLFIMCIFFLILSLISLFCEVAVFEYRRRQIGTDVNLETILPQNIQFSYRSKCSHVQTAVKQFNHLYNSLLDEEGVDVIHTETTKNVSDDLAIEIYMFLDLKLSDRKYKNRIVGQFERLKLYLDSISL